MTTSKKQYPTSSRDYELLDEVGQGISAKVYRALCKPYNEIVGVKIIELEGINNNLEEIMREAKTMRLASQKNILSLHCSFVAGQSLWMVMPYVAGGSVLSIMKWAYRDGLEESVIAAILCEVLQAMQYLHKNRYIHRDIKAGNILMDLNGEVKLGDFGVAATMERTGSWGRTGNVRQTFVGTPCWMAPEVMEQTRGYDWHADIWSFGITLLELAHGHAPFAKYPPMKVLLMTLQNEPPKLEESYGKRHFSKAMRDVVTLCLQKDPERRPTASKLLEHRLFKNAHHDKEFLVKRLLKGLPSLVERVENLRNPQAGQKQTKHALQADLEFKSQDQYVKGVSSWDFDVKAIREQAKTLDLLDEAGGPSMKVGSVPNQVSVASMLSGSELMKWPSSPGPLADKPKRTPSAHKGRFNIYVDDDDMSFHSPPRVPSNISVDKVEVTAASSAVEELGKDKVKKEQRGRFWVMGQDEDNKSPEVNTDNPPSSAQHSEDKRGRFWISGTEEKQADPPESVPDQSNKDREGTAQNNKTVTKSILPYLQNMANQVNLQHEALNVLMSSLANNDMQALQKLGSKPPSVSRTPSASNFLGKNSSNALNSSQRMPSVGSDEFKVKIDESKIMKTMEDFNNVVRTLMEENEKLKKRNLQLERELTKSQNKILQLQEERDEEEQEENIKRIEKASSEIISDRDHARHERNASVKGASVH